MFNRSKMRSNCFTADSALFGAETIFEATRSDALSAACGVGAPGSALSSAMVYCLRLSFGLRKDRRKVWRSECSVPRRCRIASPRVTCDGEGMPLSRGPSAGRQEWCDWRKSSITTRNAGDSKYSGAMIGYINAYFNNVTAVNDPTPTAMKKFTYH